MPVEIDRCAPRAQPLLTGLSASAGGFRFKLDLNQHALKVVGRNVDLVGTTVLELCCSKCSTRMTLVCLRDSDRERERTGARRNCPSCHQPIDDQHAGTVIGVLLGHGLFPSPIRLRSAPRTAVRASARCLPFPHRRTTAGRATHRQAGRPYASIPAHSRKPRAAKLAS